MTYDGGKNGEGVYQRLINQITPHDVLIECFAGSMAISRRIKPALVNIGIDKDARTLAAVQTAATAVATRLTLFEGDALELVPWLVRIFMNAGARVFVYADPPYLMQTRSWQQPLYRHEFETPEEHKELLAMLDALPCNVMLSGYNSELYQRFFNGPRGVEKWREFDYTAGSHGGARVEWCWCNYPDPVALHDYSYLGKDNTDRQRIKRKIENRVRLLRACPPLERAAIIQAVQELQTPASAWTTGKQTHLVSAEPMGTMQTRAAVAAAKTLGK